jgi:hypothetical protein
MTDSSRTLKLNEDRYTVAETAAILNVTTVRVHGLCQAGKLRRAEEPITRGGRHLMAITAESIEAYHRTREVRSTELADRKALLAAGESRPRVARGLRKQYILELTPAELALISDELPDLAIRPRYTTKVAPTPEAEKVGAAEVAEAANTTEEQANDQALAAARAFHKSGPHA